MNKYIISVKSFYFVIFLFSKKSLRNCGGTDLKFLIRMNKYEEINNKELINCCLLKDFYEMYSRENVIVVKHKYKISIQI